MSFYVRQLRLLLQTSERAPGVEQSWKIHSHPVIITCSISSFFSFGIDTSNPAFTSIRRGRQYPMRRMDATESLEI